MHYRVRYLLDFDLKLRSGQGWCIISISLSSPTQFRVNIALYSAFWSVEPTDFKNVIVENIPPALFEDAQVAEVKRPRIQNDENSIMKSHKN